MRIPCHIYHHKVQIIAAQKFKPHIEGIVKKKRFKLIEFTKSMGTKVALIMKELTEQALQN